MVTHVNAVIGVLSRDGFSPNEAVDAYEIVSDCALGSAVGEIREAEAARSGRPVAAEYLRVLATEPPDALPHLRALVAGKTGAPTDFTSRIITVLAGIALRRGEPWEPILALADSSVDADRHRGPARLGGPVCRRGDLAGLPGHSTGAAPLRWMARSSVPR